MEIQNVGLVDQTSQKVEKKEIEKTVEMSDVKNEAAIKKPISSAKEGNFTAISKDGDTLELSTIKSADNNEGLAGRKLDNDGSKVSVKMSDAVLAKTSPGRLKQLLSEHKITKQQYDKAIKAH